jgi:hypothetical protein
MDFLSREEFLAHTGNGMPDLPGRSLLKYTRLRYIENLALLKEYK